MGHPARLFIVQPAGAGTLTAHHLTGGLSSWFRWTLSHTNTPFRVARNLRGGLRQRYDLPVTAEQCADLRRRASEEF